MIGRRNGRPFECIVVDLNTQRDFCDPGGAFPVSNAGELVRQLRRVVAWTKRNHAPVVSSVEAHRPFELSDSGNPICCVDGSCGQEKLEFTVFPLHAWVQADNTLCVPNDLFSQYQQVIFQKRTDDLLGNPKADRLLSQLPVQEYVVFGTGLECSVKALALALLARGKCVSVVVDACGFWNRSTADLAVRQISAKGARLVTVDELRSRKLDRRYRYSIVRPPPPSNGRPRFANPVSRRRRVCDSPPERHLPSHPIPAKLRDRNGNSRRMQA